MVFEVPGVLSSDLLMALALKRDYLRRPAIVVYLIMIRHRSNFSNVTRLRLAPPAQDSDRQPADGVRER